jgi:hypothetical protein
VFTASVSVAGTLADIYLRARGIIHGGATRSLRFDPKCWHRDEGQITDEHPHVLSTPPKGVILVTIMRSHSADSWLVFEVAEEPKPGQVRVLLDFGGNTELLHLAESITAVKLWIARMGYRNARLEIVGAEGGDRAGGADLAA